MGGGGFKAFAEKSAIYIFYKLGFIEYLLIRLYCIFFNIKSLVIVTARVCTPEVCLEIQSLEVQLPGAADSYIRRRIQIQRLLLKIQFSSKDAVF